MAEPPVAAVTPPPALDTPDFFREAGARRESLFRAVAELATDTIFVLDPGDPAVPLRILYVNPAGARAHGYEPAELIGTSILELIDGPDRAIAPAREARILTGEVVTFEETHRHRTGRLLFIEVRARRIEWNGRRAILGINRDVSDRKKIEADFARSEEGLRLALAAGQLGVFDWDLTTGRIVWTDSHYELFGYPPGDPADVTYRHFADRVHPDDREGLERTIAVARDGGGEYDLEYRIVRPDGTVRWVYGRGEFLFVDGRAVRMVGTVKDATARKETELALRKVNDRYALLAGAMQDIIYLMGRDGIGTYVSPSCERLLGYTPAEVVGLEPTPFVHPDEHDAFARSKAKNLAGQPTHEEWRYRHKDGHWVWMESLSNPVFDDDGAVTGVVCCVRDITRRKAAEDGTRTARKLEAIGQLAGGIAHDFNNLLTVVNGCAELLLGAVPVDDPRRRFVEDVAAAGERGAALTRQLLTFSRQQPVRAGPLAVNDAVTGTARMLDRLLGEVVAVDLRLDPADPTVCIDAGQFEQVVVNLAVNARDAMPGGGRLTVSTAAVDYTGRDDRPPEARPEPYVRVSVADTGTGMTPDVLAHLFEPFFTTKPVGRGTGLGLATVHGIVRQARGFVTVESERGVGTTVSVYLPAMTRDERAPAAEPEPDAVAGGSETVLVVEDDPAVRALTCAVLERQGYDVLAAASAPEALALCDERSVPPALVVTDLIMPGMSGRELSAELATRDPAVKLIYLSGYAPDSAAFHGLDRDRTAFLQKPFTATALARLVRKTLDGN